MQIEVRRDQFDNVEIDIPGLRPMQMTVEEAVQLSKELNAFFAIQGRAVREKEKSNAERGGGPTDGGPEPEAA